MSSPKTSSADRVIRRRRIREISMVCAGILAAVLVGTFDSWLHAPAVGWAVMAALYVGWIWLVIGKMDATETAAHAGIEDSRASNVDFLVTVAAVCSLATVVVVMIDGKDASGGTKFALASLALVTTALSWMMVHTLYTLRYARYYYQATGGAEGINFNQENPPAYTDFAYMSFSIGMTYQVSDTNIQNTKMRLLAFKHSLLSFLFGTGILATTINLVVSLVNG